MFRLAHEIAVALIVCGTVLALAPPVADYLAMCRVTSMLEQRKDFNEFSIGILPLSSEYRFGLWALGGAMIVTAVAGSRKAFGEVTVSHDLQHRLSDHFAQGPA